jgi:hypothetical protein
VTRSWLSWAAPLLKVHSCQLYLPAVNLGIEKSDTGHGTSLALDLTVSRTDFLNKDHRATNTVHSSHLDVLFTHFLCLDESDNEEGGFPLPVFLLTYFPKAIPTTTTTTITQPMLLNRLEHHRSRNLQRKKNSVRIVTHVLYITLSIFGRRGEEEVDLSDLLLLLRYQDWPGG